MSLLRTALRTVTALQLQLCNAVCEGDGGGTEQIINDVQALVHQDESETTPLDIWRSRASLSVSPGPLCNSLPC